MEIWSWEFLKLGITGWKSFLFLAIWIIGNIGLFIFGYLEQQNDPGLFELDVPLGYSVLFSRGAGLGLQLQGALIFLPVCRNLIAFLMKSRVLRFLIPFDKNLHFHKIVAWSMAVLTFIHVMSHLFNFKIVQTLPNILGTRTALNILWTHPAGFTGVIMLVCLFLMITSATAVIRDHSFELFWYVHHLAIPFMAAYLSHSSGCFVKQTFPDGSQKCKPYHSYYTAAPGFLIYLIERLVREIRSRRQTTVNQLIAHPSNTYQIRLNKKSFKCEVGQYVFVNVPDVSKHQWHPFTLTSAPEDPFVGVHIRVVGDWTEAVAKRIGYYDNLNMSPKDYPVIRIDGPFGTPSQEVFDYERVVLIGAGIGVTPFAAVLRSIWHRGKDPNKKRRVKKVDFIWVTRDTQAFEWFQELLAELENDTSDDFLRFQLYVTGKMNQSQLVNIAVHADEVHDPVTDLKSRTLYGRPHFDRVFSDIVKDVETTNLTGDRQNVGVFFCGPDGLKTVLRKAAKKTETKTVKLSFHSEKF